MYDYMRALRQRFYTPPRCEELTQEYEQVRKALHDRLNREEQKLLLRMVDLQCSLRDETSLHSFLAGCRLASGIYREPAQEPPYSFDKDEEQKAEEIFMTTMPKED